MATTSSSCRVAAIAALVFTLACYGASAKSPAPESATAPSPAGGGCFNVLVNMSDCLTYVEGGSNLTKPDKGCCPELAGLVESNPICLCELLSNPDSIGIKIDLIKALKLPSVCGVTTPPVSTCSAVGVPVSLPPSIEGSPASTPSKGVAAHAPGGMGPQGSDPSPSSDEAAASPSGTQASALTFIFGLATVSVSIFF